MGLKAEIILRSIEPLSEKPAIFSIGGFSAISKDGRSFGFDWNESATGCTHDDQGRMLFTADLKDFETECYEEENLKTGVKPEDLTVEFIVVSRLTEVFYECYPTQDESNFTPLELVSFRIFEWVERDDYKGYKGDKFPDEEIARFNNEEGYESNFPDTAKVLCHGCKKSVNPESTATITRSHIDEGPFTYCHKCLDEMEKESTI